MPPELRAAAKRRRSDALARATVALQELHSGGEAITFQAVARRGGVSRQWLYTQPELRDEIERRRGERPHLIGAERASDASLRQRVQGLLAENRQLRDENASLEDELALAYGRLREQARRGPTGSRDAR